MTVDNFFSVGRCEKFKGDSSILILDKSKCDGYINSICHGSNKINLQKTKCNLLPQKTKYLHDTWKALNMKNGSFKLKTDGASPKVIKKVDGLPVDRKPALCYAKSPLRAHMLYSYYMYIALTIDYQTVRGATDDEHHRQFSKNMPYVHEPPGRVKFCT